MSKLRESGRKKRKKGRRSFEDLLREAVEAVLEEHPLKAEAESHEAGYFEELGFRLDVPESAKKDEIHNLGNALLEALTRAAANLETDWSWSVGIYQADELMRVVHPGDSPWGICRNCFDEQQMLGDACVVCGAPW